MQVANEFVVEIQRLLKGMVNAIEEDVIDFSVIDRMDLLVEATEEGVLGKKFKSLLAGISSNRSQITAVNLLPRVKSLDALLETQLFIEGVKLRSGGNVDTIAFFSPSNGDRKRMLDLCMELRSLINESEFLTPEFRNLLLKRLGAMEIQINSEKGTFDTILGGINDVGETAGKFGDDAKPLVDRFLEIFGIARKKSEQYSQLPPPEEVKQLPPPNEDENSNS